MLVIAQRLHQEGKLKESEELFRRILLSFPEHVQALHGLGILCIQMGSFDEGLSLLQKSIALEPDNRTFHIHLARVMNELDTEKALYHFRRGLPECDAYIGLISLLETLNRTSEAQEIIVQLAENNAKLCLDVGLLFHDNWSNICFQALLLSPSTSLDVLFTCAQFYIDKQESDGALPFLERACSINPQMREAYILMGDIHMERQRYLQALQAYQEAHIIDPENHEPYVRLGHSALALGKYDIAKELFQRSLEQKRDQSQVHHILADILYEEGKLHEAEGHWREALNIEPENLQSGYRLIQFLFSSYPPRYQEAEAILEPLTKAHPQESSLFNMMGHLHFVRGDRDKALVNYQKTIECNPKHTSAYHQLARYAPEPLIDQIPVWKDLLIHGDLKDDQRSHLAFALGSTFDRIGDIDSAFSYFTMANEIERRHRICSIPDIHYYLQQQCDSFAAQTPPILQNNVRFIFVVGMMRSGSTLLEQLMCARQDIFSVGELPSIPQLVSEYIHQDLDSFSSMKEKYIHTIEKYPFQKRVCLDKLLGNFAYIGWIRHAFPDARILHCVRDPMDTCWSIYRHRFIGNHPYAYHLEELIDYYSIYQSVMKFWKQQYPDFILDVHYKDVVRNPQKQCEIIDQFCSLDLLVSRSSHRKNRTTISTPSSINVRQEVYTHSVGRAKRYASYLAPLCSKLYQN